MYSCTDLIKSVTSQFNNHQLRYLKLQGGVCHSDQVVEISKLKNLISLHLELDWVARDFNVFKALAEICKLRHLKSLHIDQHDDSFMLNFPNLQFSVLESLSFETNGISVMEGSKTSSIKVLLLI